MIGGAVLALALIIFAGFQISRAVSGRVENGQEAPAATPADAVPAQDGEIDEEEQAARELEEAAQKVIDSYENLGIVQVSGYLNIRREPSLDGDIIGKLSGDGACEILETDGDWSHITSGGVDGYISNQYLLTGDEAREKAKSLVKRRAIITADSLNIRQEPVMDPSNVIGQALENERYVVLGEEDGWIQIEGGYISADYADVEYALDEGRNSGDWENVELWDMAQETLHRLEPAAAKRGIRLSLRGEHAAVWAVRPVLDEMIYNLCDNAIKYNKDNGKVTVTITPGDKIRLEVRDTGIGIPPAHQSRVFERFYRVDKSHSKEIGGTGLGLSIVKHGAQLHGADVTLQSVVGRGTIVVLSFPCVEAAAAGQRDKAEGGRM